jgi:S1-C subfamily serine protease
MAFDQTSDLALLFPVGTISVLAGLWNDRRMIQISTPVQPGNSGSPLLDQSGNVVGIVAGKLNAIQVAETRSETTQNINFAVNLGTIQSFLDSHAVPYVLNDSTETKKYADIAAEAMRYTVPA